MNDAPLYTGVDGVSDGIFGNEKLDKETKIKLDEQKKQIAELTPKIQSVIDMIDSEREITLKFITDYVDNTKDNDDNFRAELKAAGRYRKYLDDLKTKFTLDMNQVKGKS
jgi:hypothetical protein